METTTNTTTHPTDAVDGTYRFIVMETVFGPTWLPVQVFYSYNYDGTVEVVWGVALTDLPTEYVARGDRLVITTDNLVPLVVRVNPALAR